MNTVELDGLELELYKEFEAVVPDCFDQIMAKCKLEGLFVNNIEDSSEEEKKVPVASYENEDVKETVEENNVVDINTARKKKNNKVAKWLSVAAALVVVLGGGASGYYAYYTPTETIQLDVNPSIEMTVNPFGRVLSCEPINSDADPIVGSFKLEGKSYSYALEKITDAVIEAGYISEEKNAVLVSVIGENTKRIEKLSDSASEVIDNTIADNGINACVMHQTANSVSGVEKFAKSAGVSEGKAIASKRINSIINNDSVYNISKLTINELGILLGEYNSIESNISYIGRANRNGYMTKADAIAFAENEWKIAGVVDEAVQAALTVNEEGLVYLVTSGNKSENTLLVVAKSEDYIENIISQIGSDVSGKNPDDAPYVVPSEMPNGIPEIPEIPNDKPDKPDKPSEPTYITEDEAVAIALNQIPFATEVKHVSRIDRHGRELYKVRLDVYDLDYEVYVDAITGEVVGIDVDD